MIHRVVMLIIMSSLLFFCKKTKVYRTEKKEQNTSINHFRNDSCSEFIKYNGKYKTKKDSVFFNFLKYFGSIKSMTIDNLDKISETESFSFNKSKDVFKLYNISLKKVPSEVWDYQYGLIRNITKKSFCVIAIGDSNVIDFGKNTFLVGGVKESNSKGVFRLYDFSNEKIVLLFETPQLVLNKSSECIVFQPFKLVESFEDINGDNEIDLQFKGNYLSFCEGFESGPNLYDGDPIKSFGEIRYVYLQKRIKNSIMFEFNSVLSKKNAPDEYNKSK